MHLIQRAGRLFITGGSGLLGLNWAITARDRYSVVLGAHTRNVSLSGTKFENVDLESVDTLVRALVEIDPVLVVHAAGMTNIEKCELQPDLARYINVTLAANVAKACAILGIQLVHISTDHLFSGDEAYSTEESSVNPVNVYGRVKAEAELSVLESNPNALVIRTNFYAWGSSYRHSFSDLIINALRTDKSLILFEDVFYTPILAEVLVRTVHQLVERRATGIFNVVGDQRISKYDFGIMVANEFSLDTQKIIVSRISDQVSFVKRPGDMSLSNKKVRNFLGHSLGGAQEHIAMLHAQELNGLAQEARML